MDLSTLFLFLFSATLLLFSCASTNQDKTIEQIAEQIDELIGNAEADSIEQCAIKPIGVKPAGGPWGYLVYSSKDTDLEKLQVLVSDYNKLDAERNEESDTFSTGDIATEPSLKIQDGMCFGEGQYAWNPGEVLENT